MQLAAAFRMLIAALLAAAATQAVAGERACARCGCAGPTAKVCHRITETRKVTVTCYGCREEDFCLSGPSRRGAEHCESVCGADLPCAERRFVWSEWLPACKAEVFTRKKLLKRTETREIPSHKWLTEHLCGECAAQCDGVQP